MAWKVIVTKKGLPEEVMFATVASNQWGYAGWTEDMGRASL